MIKDTSIAARYARALQILTEKQAAKAGRALIPQLEQTLEELQGLAQLLAHGTRLGKFVLDPQIGPADRRRVLEQGLSGRVPWASTCANPCSSTSVCSSCGISARPAFAACFSVRICRARA